MLGEQRHTDARADVDGDVAEHYRFFHKGPDLLGGPERLFLVGDRRQADGELVATEPRDVRVAQMRREPGTDVLQQAIAGVMAEGVVDLLETIKVDQHHGDLPVVRSGLPERGGDAAMEERSISQTRQ